MALIKDVERNSKTAQKKNVPFVTRLEGAQAVSITGDFTLWSKDGIPLQKGSDGTWKASLKLSPGEYQYRLLVDGEWRDDVEAQKRVPNPYGSENGVLSVA
jgi:1,4-alpha-glucan branching enzyme